MSNELVIRYDTHDAPTLEAFHKSVADFRGVRGPQGSGKSTACVNELLIRASQQAPAADGVRYTRFLCARSTYPELKSTTIPTWQQWVPDEIAHVVGDTPIYCKLKMHLGDGTQMDMEVLFMSFGREDDIKKGLGLELTGLWINEAREFPEKLVTGLHGRTGRYPKKDVAPLTWAGTIADTNSMDDRHWWFRFAELGEWKVKGVADGVLGRWDFFSQPGALLPVRDPETKKIVSYRENPRAENVCHQPLGMGYWWRQLSGHQNDHEWIRVMIGNEYGSVFSGRPVYEGLFDPQTHVSREPLTVYEQLPLRLGFDFGTTPACVAAQISPNGQLRILREWYTERGGIRTFAASAVRPGLLAHPILAGLPLVVHCDPAGRQASQVDVDESCIGELIKLGFPAVPTHTNDFLLRREAVAYWLTHMVDGRPGMLIDPSCVQLRQALSGGYQYAKTRLRDGSEGYSNEPLKNMYSHVAEAHQYLCQGTRQIDAPTGIQGVGATALPPPPSSANAWHGYT